MKVDFALDDLRLRLGDVFRQWADQAETELMECTYGGHEMPRRGLRGRKPVLVWRSILPERTGKKDQSKVTRWRSLANAALEMQRLMYDARAHRERGQRAGNDIADHADQEGDTEELGDGHGMEVHWVTGENLAEQMRAALEEIDDIARDFAHRISGGANDDEQAGLDLAREVAGVIERMRLMDVEIDHRTALDVRRIRGEIGVRVKAMAEAEKARSLEAWTRWIRTGIDTGARNAHRYTKLPPQWKPQPMTIADGILSADPGRTVAAYRDKYVRRWNGPMAGEEVQRPRAHAPWHDAPRGHLPRPTVKELRESANSFPHDTAVAFDGLAMRHYGLISDQGLDALSYIVIAMEAIGRLPPQLEALIMPLLGKERGGHRAITTAPSLYRLWGHLRRGESQRWEAKNDRAYFAAGKGRRVQDVLWRQAVRAEAGDGCQLTSAALLWDKASYYDTMKRKRLWRMAVKHQFPHGDRVPGVRYLRRPACDHPGRPAVMSHLRQGRRASRVPVRIGLLSSLWLGSLRRVRGLRGHEGRRGLGL